MGAWLARLAAFWSGSPHTWLRQKTEERRLPAEGVRGSLELRFLFQRVPHVAQAGLELSM